MAYYSMIPNPYHDRGIPGNPKFPDGVYFFEGHGLLWKPDTPIMFKSTCIPKDPPRHCMGGRSCHIWSEKLMMAFQSAGVNNIQAFPAVITDTEGKYQWDNYFAINVIGLVKAADMNSSDYIKIGEWPSKLPFLGFKKLVIDNNKAMELNLFRLAEEPLKMIIHERIVEHLKKNAPDETWDIFLEKLDGSEDYSYI